MRERPLPLSASQVLALLEARPMRLRRVLDPQPQPYVQATDDKHPPKHDAPYIDSYCSEPKTAENPRGMSTLWCWWTRDDRQGAFVGKCPYGAPGDRLWIRETFYCDHAEYPDAPVDEMKPMLEYRVGHDCRTWEAGCPCRDDNGASSWRPSTHMPRWASRLTLEIVSVSIERLQAMTDADAVAEGVGARMSQESWSCFCASTHESFDMFVDPDADLRVERGITHVKHNPAEQIVSPLRHYRQIWDAKHKGDASWEHNPWCWVVDTTIVVPTEKETRRRAGRTSVAAARTTRRAFSKPSA
jgi:hypothetical protein